VNSKITSLAALLVLTACATPAPPVTNLNGQPIKFSEPVLGKQGSQGATFVLLEKNIADGHFTVVSISKTRQAIANDRQERVAFNSELTAFAPDYPDSSVFHTYVDTGNYNATTVIATCNRILPKTQEYSPCNSTFADVFIPMGIAKAYSGGKMAQGAWKEWQDPTRNRLRYVSSPQFALKQAGVFDHISDLVNAK
jgi:hypothetical protein